MTRLVPLVATMLLLVGCGSTSVLRSPVTLEMLTTNGPNVAAFYRVRADGAIAFGGGGDAIARRTTWTGTLTDAERASLDATLAAHDCCRDVVGDGIGDGTGSRRYELLVDTPACGRHRLTVEGEAPALAALRTVLEGASARRLDGFLDTLPKAGERRR
ncbi:MAG: hypothetical protein KDA25_05435 [Phycisphaerales bacterium]|nr:hypothetical protein [Phycisphaerales bacterium]